MSDKLTRREMIRTLTAGGLFTAGTMTPLATLFAQEMGNVIRGPQPFPSGPPLSPATLIDGKVVQPRRDLPVLRKTGVLVVFLLLEPKRMKLH